LLRFFVYIKRTIDAHFRSTCYVNSNFLKILISKSPCSTLKAKWKRFIFTTKHIIQYNRWLSPTNVTSNPLQYVVN
jgi:hypothetical protein